MPLSPPAQREHIHTRTVTCRGFRRDDGNWDVEGHLTDVKTYAFSNHHRGEVEVGEPIHEMWLRVTVDDALLIHGIEAVTDRSPFGPCAEVTPNFSRLVGLRIGRGFHRKVKELLGGTEGCTHLVELLGPIATTAVQTIFPWQERHQSRRPDKRPPILDTCHALDTHGEVVKQVWPEFWKGPAPSEAS